MSRNDLRNRTPSFSCNGRGYTPMVKRESFGSVLAGIVMYGLAASVFVVVAATIMRGLVQMLGA